MAAAHLCKPVCLACLGQARPLTQTVALLSLASRTLSLSPFSSFPFFLPSFLPFYSPSAFFLRFLLLKSSVPLSISVFSFSNSPRVFPPTSLSSVCESRLFPTCFSLVSTSLRIRGYRVSRRQRLPLSSPFPFFLLSFLPSFFPFSSPPAFFLQCLLLSLPFLCLFALSLSNSPCVFPTTSLFLPFVSLDCFLRVLSFVSLRIRGYRGSSSGSGSIPAKSDRDKWTRLSSTREGSSVGLRRLFTRVRIAPDVSMV